jgi:hypothetical protein
VDGFRLPLTRNSLSYALKAYRAMKKGNFIKSSSPLSLARQTLINTRFCMAMSDPNNRATSPHFHDATSLGSDATSVPRSVPGTDVDFWPFPPHNDVTDAGCSQAWPVSEPMDSDLYLGESGNPYTSDGSPYPSTANVSTPNQKELGAVVTIHEHPEVTDTHASKEKKPLDQYKRDQLKRAVWEVAPKRDGTKRELPMQKMQQQQQPAVLFSRPRRTEIQVRVAQKFKDNVSSRLTKHGTK